MLHNCLKGINLSLSDEAEPGNAGEQPDRNNPIDWNIKEVEYKSASEFIKYSGHLCLRKLTIICFLITFIFLTVCPFYAGAVQLCRKYLWYTMYWLYT